MYGTAGTQEGIELVLKNGATACFNHREELYWKNIVVGIPVHFLTYMYNTKTRPCNICRLFPSCTK